MTKSSDGTAKSDPKRPVTGGPNRPHPLPFVFSHFLALHTFRAQRPIVQTHNKGLLTLITPPLQHLQVTNALNLGLFFFFFFLKHLGSLSRHTNMTNPISLFADR